MAFGDVGEVPFGASGDDNEKTLMTFAPSASSLPSWGPRPSAQFAGPYGTSTGGSAPTQGQIYPLGRN